MSEAALDDAEMYAALEWYRAVGVDLAVGEETIDRFAASAAAPRRAPAAAAGAPVAPAIPMPALSRGAQAAPAPAPVRALAANPAETQALAASADTLEALQAVMNGYEGCTLKRRATQLCFGDGNPEAEIMLVGDSPGEQDDLDGKPFAGKSGQLLDKMLSAIGLDRSKVYIANMVPWRPPGNRDPSPEELALCTPFLIRQVELVAPKLLVTLGNVPTMALFQTSTGIVRMRGQWRDIAIGKHRVKALAMLHPDYLLSMPSSKALAWRDLISLKQTIDAEKN